MGEKVTIMVLEVDLQCRRCYKKVKQVLCKFPQIRDQIYDEKANTVTIKVVCCDPEKIRAKICCKGGNSIKSIEIKPPPKTEKKPELEKKPEPENKTKKPPDPKEGPPKSPAKQASPPASAYPPGGFCCTDCYHGHRGGPCYFGGPPPPPYYWPYGRPVYVNWGGGGGSTYCYCFEENPQCSVM